MRKFQHILLLLLSPILLFAQSKKKGDCDYIKGFLSITTIVKPTCYGGSDASILANAIGSGGSGGVSIKYYIDGQVNTIPSPIFTNLTSGWHEIVSESTQDKCRDTLKVFIPEPDSIDLRVKIDTVSCLLGSFTAFASGGNPGPLDIFWNTQPLATHTANLPNIAQGEIWTVTAKDVKQCMKSLTVTMPAPNPLKVNAVVQNSKCFGQALGNIFLYPNGTPPYSFKWADKNGPLLNTTDKYLNIVAGDYFVTITDASSCVYTNKLTVNDGPQVTINKKISTASCSTSNDGAIEVTPSGGTMPYVYIWSNSETTAKIEKLSGGNYKVVVIDANGCRAEETIPVTLLYPYSTTKKITNATCHDTKDGVAEVTPVGGTSPFTYIWSDSKNQKNSKAIDLEPGTYTVTATDAYQCVKIDTFIIGKPTPLNLKLNATSTKCFETNDGEATAVVSGGNGNYLIKWCDGFFGTTRTNLPGGICDVTVTDDKGCMLKDNIDIPRPAKLLIDDITVVNAKCFGDANGSLESIVSGGTQPYSYKWNDPNAQILAKANNLNKGNYTVVVTDKNDCKVSKSEDVNEPLKVTAITQVKSPKCFGDANGSFEIVASGGTNQFNYSWSNGTNTGANAKELNASSGNYNFTVTDSNNCTITETFTITDPQEVTFDLTQTFKSCADLNQNAVEVTNISGGKPNYSFDWSSGQNQSKLSNLPKGIYSVTVYDANACKSSKDITVEELNPIQADLAFVKPTCHGFADGQVGILVVSGGVGTTGQFADYDYVWNSIPLQTTPIAYDLVGNKKYEVVITDAQGCKGTASIFLTQPNPIVLTTTKVDAKCYDSKDGEAEVIAKGDNPNFIYQWDDADNQTSAKAVNLKAGSYKVTVLDDKNCSAFANLKISQPPVIDVIDTKVNNNKCFGDTNGFITVSAEGGTGQLQYAWSSKENTTTIKQLKAGAYTLTISDENQCFVTKNYTITEPSELEIALDATDVSCFDLKDGTIAVTVKGGSKPYQYSTNGTNFNGFAKLVGLRAGSYDVYVKDANGCVNVQSASVDQPEKFELEVLKDVTITFGEEATLKAVYKNNVGKVKLVWSAPADDLLDCLTCEEVVVKTKNTATITAKATDANGCKAENYATVYLIREKSIFVPTGFSPNGDGENDKLIVHGKENVKVMSFSVFDRWGELVYEAKDFIPNDENIAWDGTLRGANMPSGSYAWILEVVYPTGEIEKTKGGTMLLR